MNMFTADKCPLCDKKLIYVRDIGFECPTDIILDRGDPITHYQIEEPDTFGWVTEHLIIMPFALENSYKDNKTRVYKWDPWYVGNSVKVGNWIFVMESPQIHSDEPEKMLKRIRTLVPFA